jgi:serine/threonine-protein kinase OSR1/STK39
MSSASHPQIMNYYMSFCVRSEVWLVMPLMKASCIQAILDTRKGGIKSEPIIATIIRDTLQALTYFHELGQIHRDIKSGNILIDDDGSIFLGDFGVSAQLSKGKKRRTLVGSPCWMAPEVIEQTTGYDTSADIWSLGITAIEIAEGEAPYVGMTAMKIMLSIMNSSPPSLNADSWSAHFCDFVDHCLQKDPTKRPTAQ